LTKGTIGRMDYSNVHHIAALKGIMGIYDKVGFNSPLMKQINDVFYKKLKGLGGQSGNFMRLIGGTSDIGSPHYLAHVFLNQAIGKDGRKFFTPEPSEKSKYAASSVALAIVIPPSSGAVITNSFLL